MLAALAPCGDDGGGVRPGLFGRRWIIRKRRDDCKSEPDCGGPADGGGARR